MIQLVRAELLKLRTTQVWFWMLLLAIAVGVLAVVATLASNDVKSAGFVKANGWSRGPTVHRNACWTKWMWCSRWRMAASSRAAGCAPIPFQCSASAQA